MFVSINESFDKNYSPLDEVKSSDAESLKKLLTHTANVMLRNGVNNLKEYEIAFQDDIESFFPGKLWWEVTKCNIFMELFSTGDPFAAIDCIVNNLTVNENVDDSESETLTEAPSALLGDEDMFDPKRVNFRDVIKRNTDAEQKAQAEKERQDRIAAAKEKYKDILSSIDLNGDVEDNLRLLFDNLVPEKGMGETVAGELVRAVMRILYRDWNDGDKFFMGYGLETCGGSAQYLYDMGFSSTISSILDDATLYMDDDYKYTNKIQELAKEVLVHIVENPDLMGELNSTDSRDYHYDDIEAAQPKMDYDFKLPYSVSKYVDYGHINYTDIEEIVESNLNGNGIEFDSVECSGSGDYVWIYGLNYDDYEELQRFKMYTDSYWEYEVSEWEDEYGDPDEDDDMDESKLLKESPVYDMIPKYDNRSSFYSKARVDDSGNEKTLYSYNTPVAKIIDGKVELLPKWDWSQTTLRHVKEFLKQNGFEASSLSQMKRDYL
jgi:hypothetical protein